MVRRLAYQMNIQLEVLWIDKGYCDLMREDMIGSYAGKTNIIPVPVQMLLGIPTSSFYI